MTTEPVVARLHKAVTRVSDDPNVMPFVALSLPDATALDRLIASLCEDEQACEGCATRLCETCGIGKCGGCDHGRVLCRECDLQVCRECLDDAIGDAAAEAAADATGGRY